MNNSSLEKNLHRAEYVRLRYQLRLKEDLLLPPYALLRLRREFNRLIKGDMTDIVAHDQFKHLLRPPLPIDPALLRRVQQPSPGFILQVNQLQKQQLSTGDLLPLTVCFFGRGIMQVETFSYLLENLGQVGLSGSAGRFSLESIEDCIDLDAAEPLWRGGSFMLTPRINDLSFADTSAAPSSVAFELLTPARLLRNNRPMFKSGFTEIFPFILRRVTGMLAAWADLEDVFDVRYLLDCSRKLVESDSRFSWKDWHPLDNNDSAGGLIGSVALSGAELGSVWPLLKIGEQFGLGKGAAYGAGRYRLREHVTS